MHIETENSGRGSLKRRDRVNQVRVMLVAALAALCLLAGPTTFGQTTAPWAMGQQFEAYAKENLQEKMYLHTDKSFYLPGETIWFKVYSVEGSSHQPLALSKVAYVELLDQHQEPVLQLKVSLQDGTGAGSMVVPQGATSGYYMLRGYTNWMKNAGPHYFFQKQLTLVNTLQKLGLPAVPAGQQYEVGFYPEGGQMVHGLPGKVAFKILDQNGQSVSFTGVVLSQKNDTVATLYTHKFGMGSFEFTPQAGHTYRAVLTGPERQVLTRNLPPAQPAGMVMSVKSRKAGVVTVQVAAAGIETDGQQQVQLLVHTRQKVVFAEARSLDNQGQATFIFAENQLAEGVSHITLFNGQKPVCERLYFKRPQQQLLKVQADVRREYGPRQLIELGLGTLDFSGKPVAANLSVAVHRVDSVQTADPESIISYLWLSSDLRGRIESPAYYVTQAGPEAEVAADHLMLTQGWRRFRWEDVTQAKAQSPAYLPELAGHVIKGKVLDLKTGLPAPNVQTYLATPSVTAMVYTAQSNPKGEVVFPVKNLYGTRDLFLLTNTRYDSTYQLEIASPFSAEKSTYALPVFNVSESLYQPLRSSSTYRQLQSHFGQPVAEPHKSPPADTLNFYGKPSMTYLLDDYTRFPTIEDVMREYVKSMLIRKRRGKFHIFIIDMARKSTVEEEPLVLLDGVPIFDLDRLMQYDPKRIKKLDVISRRYYHGPHLFGGIVSYTTYKGNMEGYEIDPRALLLEYEGLALPLDFYAPVYGNQEQTASRLPDLRSTLHWAPEVKTDGQGQTSLRFYASDLPGTYVVVVQGLTPDGKAGAAVTPFEIKKPLQ